jgi:putative redox protein
VIQTDSQPEELFARFSNGRHVSQADAAADKGGGNSGFRPHELLEAALATCMCITLRMTAKTHNIPVSGVSVSVSLDRSIPGEPTFEHSVQLHGPLTELHKQQLLAALDGCPVRQTLSMALGFRSARA